MAKETIPFRTHFGEHLKVATPTGNGIEDIYGYDIDSKGRKILVKTGEKNLYAEIQSYHEECKIENILKSVAVGDMSHFRPDGIYADISEVPNNLIAARKEMQKLENLWNGLPGETKEKYNWSLEEFIGEAGKESWLIDMGFLTPEADEAAPTLKAPETTVEVPEGE